MAGAGVGGLTAALALAARGIDGVVCEREPVLREAGAGVQLGPNAVKVLDALGLAGPLRAAAFAPEAVEVRDGASGRLLMRTPLGEAAVRRWGAPYLQVHRADLQALLLEAVRACPRAELRFGAAAVAVDPAGRLRLEDGTGVDADVAVAADGLRSACAASLWGDEAPRFTGWTAWRAVAPVSAVGAGVPPVAAVWTGPGRHLVHYPVRAGREVNLVAVTAARGWREESWTARGDPAELAAAFAGWPTPVGELLAAVGETWRWALFDRPARRRWRRGRATLLGDAAHPMLPFLAQGAAMAVEDAAVLAGALARSGPGSEPGSEAGSEPGSGPASGPEAALDAYERRRAPRTAAVQRWSRGNARLFHLPGTAARAVFGLGALTGAADARLDALYGWEAT